MLFFLLKRKRFIISAIFLFTLFTWSVLDSIINNGEIRQVKFHSDVKGNILDTPPYPPLTVFALGSDRFGYDLAHIMIIGAKWTIGITVIIVIFRMLLSIIVGSFIYSLNN